MNKLDEICYPFMNEDGLYCDYEILSDGLSSYLGLLYSISKERDYPEDLSECLLWLTEMVLHLDGSLRGKLAISEIDLKDLYSFYYKYKNEIHISGFTLPTGSYLACQINIARYKSKELVRLLNKINKLQCPVPDIIFSFANLLANFLFVLSCYVNDLDNEKNISFTSKSY